MTTPRPTSTATIAFGLVAIPVRTYTATDTHSVSFSNTHRKCGSKLKQSLACPKCGQIHDGDKVKSLAASDGRSVAFEADELAALESPRVGTIEVVEFVPLAAVDPIYIDGGQYVGPADVAPKAYSLLIGAMLRANVVAICRYHAKGKTRAVMLRPLRARLVLHYLHFAGEVRDIGAIDVPGAIIPPREQAMADQLVVANTSDTFDPSKYRDEYSDRVRAAADAKAAGLPAPEEDARPDAQIIDLMAALRASLAKQAGGAP